MKLPIALFGLFVFSLFVLGCGPPNLSNDCQNTDRFPQNFSAKEALFIRERNCAPHILASAFLIDRERGLFASAKHFVGNESDGQAKVFFNGRVYDGFLVQLPPITDVAVVKIQGNFDPTTFPEAYGLSQAKIGDKVFVKGIHPHPKQLTGNNKIILIYEVYYGLIGEPQILVYESIEADIISLNLPIKNKDLSDEFSEDISEISNNYINLKMAKNHLFTFGGLSGGPTVNERGEVVGINANQLPKDCVPRTENCIVQGEPVLTKSGLKPRPFDELNIVPASELEKLIPLLADIK
ncbi:MAG: trypsin-like peptidase domain-containing protein [Candidatus Yanofskybacteria bacterium]|nr:trypsin-like peptidase domain-containing protein [Candidatus Yanofskybacteria bacterium]